MAIIKSGATSDNLTIDPTSKAARITPYTESGRSVAPQSKATFYVTNSFTPPATPTDMITIYGSASKTVQVISFKLVTTNTAAGSQQFQLTKRTSANSGGTFVAGTAIAADSNDTATATSFGHYTANAASLGTSAGNIIVKRVASPAAVPASFAGVVVDAGVEFLAPMADGGLARPVTLRGTSQGLCLNFNGAALVAGQTHLYQIVWTEE